MSTSKCQPNFCEQQDVFVAWFTGLSGAGKTTLTLLFGQELKRRGVAVAILDGDRFRREISPSLGFTKNERDANVERIARAAAAVARSGTSVLVAAIAPYEQGRRRARSLIEPDARFVEIHVNASLEVCIGRDPKGLYREALTGRLPHFTGISDPYESPTNPDLLLDTDILPPHRSVAQVLRKFEELAILPPRLPG